MRSSAGFIILMMLVSSVLLFQSCGESWNPNKEIYVVSAKSKKWLADTYLYEEFSLTDSFSFSEFYLFESEWSAFNSSKSTSGLLGLQDRVLRDYEVIHQTYKSQLNKRFAIEIEALDPPSTESLEVVLRRTYFRYDLTYKKLLSLSTKFGRRPDSEFVNDQWVDHPFLSHAIQHDTIVINDVVFYKAMEFVLGDFEDQWVDTTIVNIILAKEVGLLQYTLHNGQVFSRVQILLDEDL